jgi:uncharacterized membrane protein
MRKDKEIDLAPQHRSKEDSLSRMFPNMAEKLLKIENENKINTLEKLRNSSINQAVTYRNKIDSYLAYSQQQSNTIRTV